MGYNVCVDLLHRNLARGFLYNDSIVTRKGRFASMLSASCLHVMGQQQTAPFGF